MSNFVLLQKTRLAKMVEEYLTLVAREVTPTMSEGGCLVQIISTNPFEISDSINYIQVKDPACIIEEMKLINSNINLLSMKGSLILLKKWTFECAYISASNDLKINMRVEEVEYVGGIGTTEISMETTPVSTVTSLQNKFKRLKKFFIAQEFDSSHPVEEAIDVIEEDIFKASEGVKKADLRGQNLADLTLDPKNDPFLVWSNDQYGGKSSMGKSQLSQLSQMSDYEILSINSATQNKFDRLKSKQSFQKKPFQSLPANDPFSLNLDLLSSQPLIQNNEDKEVDICEQGVEEGVHRSPNFGQEEEEMRAEQERYIDITELAEKEVEKDAHQKQKGNSQDSTNQGEDIESEIGNTSVNEVKSPENNLKRNFHDMIKQNKIVTSIDSPRQELKKLKYQWGLNHKSEQQSFIKNLEGKRSFGQVSSDMDTLLLLSDIPAKPQEQEANELSSNDNRMTEEVANRSIQHQQESSELIHDLEEKEPREAEGMFFTNGHSFGFHSEQKRDSSKRSTQSFGFPAKEKFITVRKKNNDGVASRDTEKSWSFGKPQESPRFAQLISSCNTSEDRKEVKETQKRTIRNLKGISSNSGKSNVINLDDEEDEGSYKTAPIKSRRERQLAVVEKRVTNEKIIRKKPQHQEELVDSYNKVGVSRDLTFRSRNPTDNKAQLVTNFVDYIDLTEHSSSSKPHYVSSNPLKESIQQRGGAHFYRPIQDSLLDDRQNQKPSSFETEKKKTGKSAKHIPDPFNPNKSININEFKSVGGKTKKPKTNIQVNYNNFKQKNKPPIEIL